MATMARRMSLAGWLLVSVLFHHNAWAADQALEERVRVLSSELRCLVCQNQTIADSNADLAKDLRLQISQMLANGQSDQQVRDYMVARYGDFVLYRPPLKSSTVFLWLMPLVAGVFGVLWLIRTLRRRNLASADNGNEVVSPVDNDAGWRLRASQLLAEDQADQPTPGRSHSN